MSLYVTGFDFGTQNCTIAVAQKGGIDVIANEVSNRLTPSMVGYDEKQRHVGEPAATQYQRNIKNTITNLKQLLGHPWDDPELQAELKNLPFKVVKNEKNQPDVEVSLGGETKRFSLVAIVASLLVKLKEITERACQGRPCKDVAISCPGFWTDQQRRALLDASKIAGLNCVKIVNETTASALAYGIYKTEFSDTTPTYVMFVDMGHAHTSVAVVEYLKGKLKIVGTAYDRTLGGRDFDEVLVEHFLKEFKEKFRVDIRSNQRAMIRLRVAAEKLKKVLNQTPEGVLNIDSIMNDIDVKGVLKREQYVEMCQTLLNRLADPINQALKEAGLTPDKLHSVEVTGGGTRFKPVQAKLCEILNKPEVSNTLNSEEAVARGCALQCAMLSPVFRVREFSITDISPYPIKVSWKDIGTDAMVVDGDSLECFSKNNVVPSSKYVTLYRKSGFELIAEYVPSFLPPGIPSFIGKWIIPNIPANPTEKDEPVKLRVKVKLDLNGIVNVESAQTELVVFEEEKKEEKKEEPVKKPEENASSPPPQQEQQQQQGNADKPAEQTSTPPEQKDAEMKEANQANNTTPTQEPVKKKKIRRTDLIFSTAASSSLTERDIQLLTEDEAKMLAADRLVLETAEKKNAVESYVYDMRSKLSESLSPFITPQDKETFLNLLAATEDWLYNEGDDQTKSVYASKLAELQALGDPVVRRRYEAENRYHALKQLRESIASHRLTATSLDPKYEHIPQEERQKVIEKCNQLEAEINDAVAKQEALPKHVDPVILSAEIERKKIDLDAFASLIMNKPKPAPPKPEPKKEEPKKEEAPQQQGQQQNQQQQPEQKSQDPNDVKMEDAEKSSSQQKGSNENSEMDLD